MWVSAAVGKGLNQAGMSASRSVSRFLNQGWKVSGVGGGGT